MATFYFSSKCEMNGGIISSLFSTSLVFTIAIFYFKYNQKVTIFDVCGACFIIASVALIGFSVSTDEDIDIKETEEKTTIDPDDASFYLFLSVISSIVTGLSFTLETVSIQYVIGTGFDLDQSNYDGTLILFVLTFPLFMYEWKVNEFDYTWKDISIATVSMILVSIAVIFYSRALSLGIAASVQAIENSKTVV